MFDPLCRAVFVYGTLKQGEERSSCWPRRPQSVEPAVTYGTLFDLGPYPALHQGSDPVQGELWTFAGEDLAATLSVLDAIECYGVGEVDLYVRRIIECRTAGGRSAPAFAYFIADPKILASARRVLPGPEGTCRWSARGA